MPATAARTAASETGLPLSTYFSGLKLRWLFDHVEGARAAAEAGDLPSAPSIAGSSELRRLYGGLHATDVTNAARTQLLNIATLQWDEEILSALQIPRACLPEIRSSSEIYGRGRTLAGVPIAGVLGDQHAALLGQACLKPGEAKNTYGTGCFLLMNTGPRLPSRHGLLTTLGYKLGDAPPVYALEGSIAITGALVQWLRDNLGLIRSADEIEALARGSRRQRRCLFRPGFFRPLCPALARARARRDLWASPVSPTSATLREPRSRRPPSRPARSSRR